jgi:6,7-dimethyl-8-ribityllumazine synthase
MAGPRTSFHVNLAPLPGARVLVVEGRYYGNIADALLEGARRVLEAAQVEWDIVTVPGALEVAQAVAMAFEAPMHARRMPYDGIVALGCVIRGETSHYDIVARESAAGLHQLAVQHAVPIGFGILTCESREQAWERASVEGRNKGRDAARACLTLMQLEQHFSSASRR